MRTEHEDLVECAVNAYIRREYYDKGIVFCNYCNDRQRAIKNACKANYIGKTDDELREYIDGKKADNVSVKKKGAKKTK